MHRNYRRTFKNKTAFRDRSMALGLGNDFDNGHRGHAKRLRESKEIRRTRARLEIKRSIEKELNE